MPFASKVVKATKHNTECHIIIINIIIIIIIIIKNSFLYKIYKNGHMISFNINN